VDASHASWSELESDHPMEGIARQRVIGEKMMVSRVELEAGLLVPSHSHDNEQMAIVVSGRLRFTLGPPEAPTETLEAAAGEVVLLPGGMPHAAEVLERAVVLDVFSPPSETTGIDG
jgi:quercetin dioxygenase-like cupin family protein